LKKGIKTMVSKKSPGGSLFPYYYKDGELFGLHLGSFKSNEAGVIARMKAEESFITQQRRSLPLWIDFYQTALTHKVVSELIEMLKHIYPYTPKLGMVGCSFGGRWKISSLMKKTEHLSTLPVRYFDDPEEAKTWLVSETE
jgi:hypothetical protein